MGWYHWVLMGICFVAGWWVRSKFDKQVEAVEETFKTKPPTA